MSERDSDTEEGLYATGRVPGRTYLSKPFEVSKPFAPLDPDIGSIGRFLCRVFDNTDGQVALQGDEYIIRTSPGGRVQLKLLVCSDDRHVREIWVHRVDIHKGTAETLFKLDGEDASRFVTVLRSLSTIPLDGTESVRFDDDLLLSLVQDPSAMARLYRRNPILFRRLISSDSAAEDLVASARRRSELDRFESLLTEDEVFDAAAEDAGSFERVWQNYFEDNKWVLGVGLTTHLLFSWDPAKLEQIIAGSSIAHAGKRVDALMRTAGAISSLVFAEIKTHRTQLISREYRSGAWSPSAELSGAISQSHATVQEAIDDIGHRLTGTDGKGFDNPSKFAFLYQPRSFVVAGTLNEFVGAEGGVHEAKFRSFEMFRRNLVTPELLTFDSLLERARWIVGPTA